MLRAIRRWWAARRAERLAAELPPIVLSERVAGNLEMMRGMAQHHPTEAEQLRLVEGMQAMTATEVEAMQHRNHRILAGLEPMPPRTLGECFGFPASQTP